MKKWLIVALLLILITMSFSSTLKNTAKNSESNATKAIILYNRAISQLAMQDYTDAFKNLKLAQELLPTISSVVDGFQKTYDEAKYNYTKQMILINKLNVATSTSKTETKKTGVKSKNVKPLIIYSLLGFLLFFTLTYSILYFVEIKKSIISGIFVSFVISLASKYGYTAKPAQEDEEENDYFGDDIEIEEVSQEETGKIENKITPEDVEDENVEEILSQLLGINEEEPKSEEELDEEEIEEKELSETTESSEETASQDEKELSSTEEISEKTYSLKIDQIKDPRNEMILTIERLKDEIHQIVSALKEKEIKNQDDLDNALKIMYVYATMSTSRAKNNDNVEIEQEGGNDA